MGRKTVGSTGGIRYPATSSIRSNAPPKKFKLRHYRAMGSMDFSPANISYHRTATPNSREPSWLDLHQMQGRKLDLLCPMSSKQPNDRCSMSARKAFYFVASSLLAAAIGSSIAFAEEPDISVAAFGIHRCGDGQMCAVTGSFSDCKQATILLTKQDCCAAKARSVGFSLEACTRDGAEMDRRTSR